jgi:hypothetical protein
MSTTKCVGAVMLTEKEGVLTQGRAQRVLQERASAAEPFRQVPANARNGGVAYAVPTAVDGGSELLIFVPPNANDRDLWGMKPQEERSSGRPADRRLVGPQFCAGFGNGILLGYLMYGSGRATPDGPLLSHNST